MYLCPTYRTLYPMLTCSSNINSLIETIKNAESLRYAFWLSVVLLILVSLFKYFISKESKKRDWGEFILEFPIDVCLVVITIIITGFMKGENFDVGIMLVIISLIISFVCCMLRRESIRRSYDEGQKIRSWLLGFANIILASVWIFYIYSNL